MSIRAHFNPKLAKILLNKILKTERFAYFSALYKINFMQVIEVDA